MMAEGLEPSLAHYLEHTGLELEDIYASNRSWSDLLEAAGCDVLPRGPDEKTLRRAVGRLLHVNDAGRQRTYRALLSQETAPLVNTLSVGDARLLRMVVAMLLDSVADKNTSMKAGLVLLWQHPQVRHEVCLLMNMLEHQIDHVNQPLSERPDVPIATHARYSRIEILAAFGVGDAAKDVAWREGVRWVSEAKADVFVFTLDKSSGSFSPTTRYRDYAISPKLIHWESQAATTVASLTGQRYLNHVERSTGVYLFARLNQDDRAFWCLGPAHYVRHQGEQPIAITWQLDERLPGDLFAAFRAAGA